MRQAAQSRTRGLLEFGQKDHARAVIVVAHGGKSKDRRRDSNLRPAALRMLPFSLDFARRGRGLGLAVAQLRYRNIGFNEGGPVEDLTWALDRMAAKHGAPICVVGHSMGARAAMLACGHPAVTAVAGLATWITPEDRIDQAAGRTVMLAHGLRDRVTDPARSYALAVQLRAVGARSCRFEVARAGHTMLDRRSTWHELSRGFAFAALGLEPYDERMARAFDEPADRGCRVLV
jgi:dienelactone hydrolase